MAGPGALAEDAAQEAALRAWRQRDRCQNPERPGGWIATIARREALRCLSQHRREAPLEESLAEDPAPAGAEQDVLLRVDLQRALAELAPDDRRLLLGRYWADLTQVDLGSRLGLADGTVKVRLHRLRARLRVRLAEA